MSKILEKIRGLAGTMQTLSNFKRIGNDFYRNFMNENAKDLRTESLVPENFILYLPEKDLPPNFGVHDTYGLYKHLQTKIGDPYSVMRMRVVDGTPNYMYNNLFFLVNPASLQISQEKSHSDYVTRTGPKSEYWGNKPATLSFDGTSGGFYGLDENSGYGVNNFLRTLSFKNVASIVTFYKNNGFVYGNTAIRNTTTAGATIGREKDVRRVDLIEITYRDTVYLGSFSSMSLTYSSSSPSKIAYSFTFVAYRQITV